MASLRRVKKDIDYLVSEVVYDCYLALYFHSERRDAIVAVMVEAVDARNEFYEMANHPAEKHNKSLVKKHYAFLRNELMERIDGLFDKLSKVVNEK